MLVLGLDIGTQSAKALLLDANGAVRGTAAVDYPIDTPHPGWAEQAPETWWAAACEAIRQVIGQAPEPVATVALSGQMHGVALLSARGEPVRPAILWTDARAGIEAKELRETVPQLVEIAGNPIMASFSAPKLVWLARHEAAVLKRARWFLLPKDYVRLRLTGEVATDPSDASGTLLFDLCRRQWASDVIGRIGLDPAWFPPVVASGAVAGYITHEAAEQTGLKQGIPVLAGGADMAMGAVGAGLIEPDVAGVLLSTAGQVLLTVERIAPEALGRVYYFAHAIPDRYFAMGALLSAGLSLRWLRDVLRGVSFA
ncbi:MAG: FGGY family carbohydrate kinase, partial [Bacillota bacterium]